MTDSTPSGAIWYPWKRGIRTALQIIVSVLTAFAGALVTFNLVAPQVLEAAEEILPPTWYAWAVGALAFTATVGAVLARIMAIPQVDAFLKRFGAGSSPRSVMTVEEAAESVGSTPETLTRDQYRDATGE